MTKYLIGLLIRNWLNLVKFIVTIQPPKKLKVNFLTFLNFLKFSQVNFCTL
ncbi:hypothetical protein MSIBF_A2680024 [groundwater metagenome]|uniref:Uncharacterized protein n=1 Tax=groundwater metagenome TaxID=717931 RepID=A0A098E9R3_9ZZZZ